MESFAIKIIAKSDETLSFAKFPWHYFDPFRLTNCAETNASEQICWRNISVINISKNINLVGLSDLLAEQRKE